MTVDGHEVEKGLLGSARVRVSQTTKLVVTDRFVKVADGRPLELDRHFDELTRTRRDFSPGSGPKEEIETLLESELESRNVRFSWNAAARVHDCAWVGLDEPPDLLVGLREDLDLRALLPGHDVDVGAQWKVVDTSLPHWLSLAGDLHFRPPAAPEGEPAPQDLGRQLDENLRGQLAIEFTARREEGGHELAALAVSGELRSRLELTEGGFVAEATLEPRGQLVWDLTAQRLHAFHVDGKLSLSVKGDQQLANGGERHTAHVEMTLSGRCALDVDVKQL